ncbi:unnamed protein product [Laminaria digitata]
MYRYLFLFFLSTALSRHLPSPVAGSLRWLKSTKGGFVLCSLLSPKRASLEANKQTLNNNNNNNTIIHPARATLGAESRENPRARNVGGLNYAPRWSFPFVARDSPLCYIRVATQAFPPPVSTINHNATPGSPGRVP